MSRNAKKITKALAEKGYQPRETHWEPVGHACEMCGPEGGWYIEVETLSADADGDHDPNRPCKTTMTVSSNRGGQK